jgi:hypothetical protein
MCEVKRKSTVVGTELYTVSQNIIKISAGRFVSAFLDKLVRVSTASARVSVYVDSSCFRVVYSPAALASISRWVMARISMSYFQERLYILKARPPPSSYWMSQSQSAYSLFRLSVSRSSNAVFAQLSNDMHVIAW